MTKPKHKRRKKLIGYYLRQAGVTFFGLLVLVCMWQLGTIGGIVWLIRLLKYAALMIGIQLLGETNPCV